MLSFRGLLAFEDGRFAGVGLEPFAGERRREVRVEVLAREDVDVHRLKHVEGVDDDAACQDEADRGRALGMGQGLPLLRRQPNVVPEMHLAFLHVDTPTEFGKIGVDVFAVEPLRITTVEIEDQFATVRRHILLFQIFDFHQFEPIKVLSGWQIINRSPHILPAQML